MERIRIVGLSLLVLSCWTQHLHGETITTNDIDVALNERLFVGPGSYDYHRALSKVNRDIQESGTNETGYLKRHLFCHLLGFSVSTNMFRADVHLREKAEWVNRVAEWTGDALGERDVLAMLASATGVCEVATNDLAAARIAAREKDRALGWSEGSAGHPWSPARANQRAWAKERDRRNAWNAAVEKYRQQMIMTCMRRLDVLWKDVAEAERRRNIRNAVESFGLTMPEDE